MKMFISIFFVLNMAFAYGNNDWEGGQTGNGGNGCWINTKGEKTWKTIEEIRHWRYLYQEERRYKEHTWDNVPKLKIRPAQIYYTENLLDTEPAQRALVRIARLKKDFPLVYSSIVAYADLLKEVSVAQFEVRGVYEGDITQFLFNCKQFSPALMTQDNREVFVFRPVWNELTNFSAEVVLTHEIIRFSQMFGPAFFDMTNAELQRLTAYLFSSKVYSNNIFDFLERFERRLSRD